MAGRYCLFCCRSPHNAPRRAEIVPTGVSEFERLAASSAITICRYVTQQLNVQGNACGNDALIQMDMLRSSPYKARRLAYEANVWTIIGRSRQTRRPFHAVRVQVRVFAFHDSRLHATLSGSTASATSAHMQQTSAHSGSSSTVSTIRSLACD